MLVMANTHKSVSPYSKRLLYPELLVLAFGVVRTQGSGVVDFKPFPWQKRYLRAARKHSKILIDKSRDIGSSTIAVLYYTANAVLYGGDFLIASYKKESAMFLYETAVLFLDSLKRNLARLGYYLTYDSQTKSEVILSNGTHIKALEMSPKVGRSFRFKYLLASEVAFWDEARESFKALQGAGVPDSHQTLESTPNPDDSRGVLWEELLQSPGYYKMREDWRSNPKHTQEWAQHMKTVLGDRGFAQEFECDHTRSVSGSIVIPLELYENAIVSPGHSTGSVTLGVDVARYGDDNSVIAVRDGNSIVELLRFSKLGTEKLADEIANIVLSGKYNVVRVNVDAVGVGGGVVDALYRKNLPCEIVEVIGSATPVEPEKFVNTRAEMYFNLKQQLLDGAHLPQDKDLKEEILHTHYKFSAGSRIQIESKDQIKKHLKHSPDELDAIALAFYDDILGNEVVGGLI